MQSVLSSHSRMSSLIKSLDNSPPNLTISKRIRVLYQGSVWPKKSTSQSQLAAHGHHYNQLRRVTLNYERSYRQL